MEKMVKQIEQHHGKSVEEIRKSSAEKMSSKKKSMKHINSGPENTEYGIFSTGKTMRRYTSSQGWLQKKFSQDSLPIHPTQRKDYNQPLSS